MKRAIFESGFVNKEKITIGFCPEYMWKAVSYFVGPKKSGRYLVIGKDGAIREMFCTGTHESSEKARTLFDMAASCAETPFGDAYIDEKLMTDTDLMNIYRNPWGLWYKFVEWHEYEDCHDDIYIFTNNSDEYPLYFLDFNLEDKIVIDEHGEMTGSDGEQFFEYDRSGNMIKKEENK